MNAKDRLKMGNHVQVNCSFDKSARSGWRDNNLREFMYGTVAEFHPSVLEAVRIRYKFQGGDVTSYCHFLDLDVVSEIPVIAPPGPVLFDENNLDT